MKIFFLVLLCLDRLIDFIFIFNMFFKFGIFLKYKILVKRKLYLYLVNVKLGLTFEKGYVIYYKIELFNFFLYMKSLVMI